jgi:hypothetical protein
MRHLFLVSLVAFVTAGCSKWRGWHVRHDHNAKVEYVRVADDSLRKGSTHHSVADVPDSDEGLIVLPSTEEVEPPSEEISEMIERMMRGEDVGM